jgi:nuclear transport factor 2 (NTF2) superfamily protein
MNGTMIPGIGSGRMAMRIGNSTNGLMRRRYACINDLPIQESDRKYRWDRTGPRPAGHAGLTELGL